MRKNRMARRGPGSKTRFFLVIGFYVIVLIVWYMVVYGYINGEMAAINQQRQKLNAEMSKLPTLIQKTQRMTMLSDSLNQELKKLQEKAFTIADIQKVKNSLTSFCKQHNLKIDEFSTITQIYYTRVEQNPNEVYFGLPANIVFEGDFSDVIRFLKNLDTFDYALHFSYLRIVPALEKENRIRVITIGNFLVRKPGGA